MSTISRRFRPSLITLATAYADQSADSESIELPADLATLDDEALAALSARASEAFDAIYGDGSSVLSTEDYATAAALTDAIESLSAEEARRDADSEQRRADTAALASRVQAATATEEPQDGEDGDDADGDDTDDDLEPEAQEGEETAPVEERELVTASGTRRSLSINLGAANRRSRRSQPKPKAPAERGMRDYAFANSDDLGVGFGAGITHVEAGQMLGKRLSTFAKSTYEGAARRGQHMREQHPLMVFKRDIPADLMVASATSVEEASRAITRAVDQSRLPGGALTAAGWCAPSEPLYDICTTASRDGLYSLPEVGISRGGILVPTTPAYADLYQSIGFHFTEEQAIAGEYAPGTPAGTPNVVGDKPCYEMECPTWEDYRLEADGLCLVADLVTQRGYPEGLEWATENALIAHDHKVSAGRIAKVVAGSTPRVMTAGTVGTTAPLLAAIEIRAEAIRYAGRLSRNTLLEGVFPYWVRGAIRQDLSVRLGVDLLSVTNAQIDAWFAQRGIVPQYVYDWQALPIGALTWPATIQFLLYEAGAWIGGVDEIITLNSVYDSVMLGQNKYTALFTEEAWLVAPRCGLSELVTVPVVSDGSTHAGVLLTGALVGS